MLDQKNRSAVTSGIVPAVIVAGLLFAAAWLPLGAVERKDGLVDGTRFLELVGDDALRLEVNLGRALIVALSRIDPELQKMASGLDSMRALILDLSKVGVIDKARGAVRTVEHELRRDGWERIALVREEEAEIQVLVLNDSERIRGLVVMIVDASEAEPTLVFANVAGDLDLATIQQIGQQLDVPGLRELSRP